MTTAVVRNRISYLTNNLSQRHASLLNRHATHVSLRTQMRNKISVPVTGPSLCSNRNSHLQTDHSNPRADNL